MGVVVAGVHTDGLFRASRMDLTILLDEVVVANAFVMETGIVTGAEHVERETLVGARGAAVNDNKIDFSHNLIFFSLRRLR